MFINERSLTMKKVILVLGVLFSGFSANAQMTDTLGALAIQGELSTEGYKAINQGQQALNRLQFQQDLAALVADIQMTHMGNYNGLSKAGVMSEGIRGANWDVAEDGAGGFVVSISGIDGPTCFTCKSPNFGTKKVEINGGGDCNSANNNVKMYFN
jgi:hypothetical protein